MRVLTEIAGQGYERGDGVWLGGTLSLRAKKRASTYTFELADPDLAIFNALPLPTRTNRTLVTLRMGRGVLAPVVFTGYVSGLDWKDTPGRLQVTCVDKSRSARRKQRAKTRSKLTLLQLVRDIADPEGLTIDTSLADAETIGKIGQMIQHGETDWRLLERLAKQLGHAVYVDGDKLMVVDEGQVPGEATVELQRGVNIRSGASFKIAERRARSTATIFDFSGDPVSEEEDGEAERRPTKREPVGLRVLTEGAPSFSAQAVQKARKAQSRRRKVFTASIEATELLPATKPRGVATVQGYGSRLDGLWWVDDVEHDLTRLITSVNLHNEGSDA